MINIFKVIFKPIKKINDVREYVEDLIASGFEKIQGNKIVDKGEELLADAIMTAIEAKTGTKIPQDVKTGIKKGVVCGLDKTNIALVRQLRK